MKSDSFYKVGASVRMWRPAEGSYDQADQPAFDRFVASFRFLVPSFYERLIY